MKHRHCNSSQRCTARLAAIVLFLHSNIQPCTEWVQMNQQGNMNQSGMDQIAHQVLDLIY